MNNQPTSERDSLMEAIALAQKEVAQAQDAQKETEGKIPGLQTKIDKQHTTFVFLHSQLEQKGMEMPWEEDLDARIKSLESGYEQLLAETHRLKELLDESVKEEESDAASGSMSAPIVQDAPMALDPHAEVEIEAAPRHEKRR